MRITVRCVEVQSGMLFLHQIEQTFNLRRPKRTILVKWRGRRNGADMEMEDQDEGVVVTVAPTTAPTTSIPTNLR